MINQGLTVLSPCTRCLSQWFIKCSLRRHRFSVTYKYIPTYFINSRGHSTKTGAQKNDLYNGNDVSLEQSVRLSRQGCENDDVTSARYEGKAWIRPQGYDTGLVLHNSLTKRKDPLILPHGKLATWYSCGPTVYDYAHIGHACAYIRSDLIRRVMTNMFGIDIVMVVGVTDIDDKIIKKANESKRDVKRLAKQYEKDFFSDMDLLKVLPPTVKTRVTNFMPDIIRFIQQILANGFAYTTTDGNVYFDVNHYGKYGRLWTHSMTTTIREAADKQKKSARDFALWKTAKPGEPWWQSPWGRGRPGWHIECSTMAGVMFGQHLDIHSGGDDLRFPHHENEMAQSEACFCNEQWTNYWMHTGHLHLKNDASKMSKSLNNTILVTDLLKHYTANQFRIFCMLSPYRHNIEYSDESMQRAVSIHRSLAAFINSAEAYIRGTLTCQSINAPYLMQCLIETRQKVESALADDFNFPKSINALEDLVRKANIELSKKSKDADEVRSPGVMAAMVAYVDRLLNMWGIQFAGRQAENVTESDRRLSSVMDSVVKFRSDMRQYALHPPVETPKTDDQTHTMSEKDQKREEKRLRHARMKPVFEACDELRDDLYYCGLQIKDYERESSWEFLEKSSMSPKGKK